MAAAPPMKKKGGDHERVENRDPLVIRRQEPFAHAPSVQFEIAPAGRVPARARGVVEGRCGVGHREAPV